MKITSKRAAHVNGLILYDVLISKMIDTSHPMISKQWAAPTRYHADTWGIPTLIEVYPWDRGTCQVRWVMWPISDDVNLTGCQEDRWPGDVWGAACFEWHSGLQTGNYCWIKQRRNMARCLDELPTHFNGILQEYLNSA